MDHLPHPSPDSARDAVRSATYNFPMGVPLPEDELRDLLDRLTPAQREAWARGTWDPWTCEADWPDRQASIARVGQRLGIPAEPFEGSKLLADIDAAERMAHAGDAARYQAGRGMPVDPELVTMQLGTRVSRRALRGAGRHALPSVQLTVDGEPVGDPIVPGFRGRETTFTAVDEYDDRSPVGKRIVVALAVLALLAAVLAIVNLRGG